MTGNRIALWGIVVLAGLVLLNGDARSDSDPALRFGEPLINGGGCPRDTVYLRMRATGERKHLFARFNKFEVRAGGDSGQTFESSECQLSIPVLDVPKDQRLVVSTFALRAAVGLPVHSEASVRVEPAVDQSRGELLEEHRYSDLKDIRENVRLRGRDLLATQCGLGANLNFNFSVQVKDSSGKLPHAFLAAAQIEQLDLVFRLEPCEEALPLVDRP